MGPRVDSPSYNEGEEDATMEDTAEQDKEQRQELGEPIQEELEETQAPPPQDQGSRDQAKQASLRTNRAGDLHCYNYGKTDLWAYACPDLTAEQ